MIDATVFLVAAQRMAARLREYMAVKATVEASFTAASIHGYELAMFDVTRATLGGNMTEAEYAVIVEARKVLDTVGKEYKAYM